MFSKAATRIFLGRWNVAPSYSVVNKKIDFSNVDHCGMCFLKSDKEKEKETETGVDESDLILSMYCFTDLQDSIFLSKK